MSLHIALASGHFRLSGSGEGRYSSSVTAESVKSGEDVWTEAKMFFFTLLEK